MKLANPDWVNTLQWDICHPASLILEDPQEYRSAIEDLTRQDSGENGKIVFSENGDICTLARDGILIRDLWAVDINQKKLISGVQKQLIKIGQEEYYSEFSALSNQLERLLEKLSQDSMLPLQWDQPENLAPFLKACSLRLETAEDPFERLIDLARLSREFLNIRFLVLVGVRSFLGQADCTALCRDLAGADVSVLFLDPCSRCRLPEERQLILDSDHCELLLP